MHIARDEQPAYLRRLKAFLVSIFDASVVIPSQHLQARLRENQDDRISLFDHLWSRAIKESADYVEPRLESALLFRSREQLWDHALRHADPDGLIAEFGVFSGNSINYLASRVASLGLPVYGFDSFEGLPTDWPGSDQPRGAFNLSGFTPCVADNVELIKGWFDQSVPDFLSEHAGSFSLVHFDADTYGSTSLVLNLIKPRLRPSCVIIFDEYLGFPNWRNGEFRAWQEFVLSEGIRYEYLGFSNQQAAVRIL